MKEMLKSILAGMAIAYGGIGYLSQENHVVGALFFSLGLIVIYLFGWNLYTGKACYLVENGGGYLKMIGVSFVGNLIGTVVMGYLFRLTKLQKLLPVAEEVSQGKLSDNYFSAFIMAIGCGLMIYFAIAGYNKNTDGFGKYFTLVLPIIVFTVSGYEHVVADMFYFSFANAWNLHTALYLLVVGAGNLVGCSLVPLSIAACKKLK